MRRPRLLLGALVALAALTAAALPPRGGAAGECSGISVCIPVSGPWVAVPGSGEVDFLLECPGTKGLVAGTAALVSSQQIHVSFDAIIGSPVASGRTTNFEVLFRAVSGDGVPGFFEPFLGCIPTQGSGGRSTTGVVYPVGPPLDLRAEDVTVVPGAVRRALLGCAFGEQLVDSWTATAFATSALPRGGLAAAIKIHAGTGAGSAAVSVAASTALPRSARALVQLGVRCTPS